MCANVSLKGVTEMTSRIALVTGGTGGIGTEICKSLFLQGTKVVAAYNRGGPDNANVLAWQDQMRRQELLFETAYGDLSNFESAASLVDHVETQHGPIDILVNNAGITRDSTLKKMDPADWTLVLRTNLDSVFNITRQVISGMIDRGFGRIINISSINGTKGQFGQTNYAAAKAGMLGFTKSLALEVAKKGVTVNAISPGYVATKMVKAMPEKVVQQIIDQIPVGRLAEPAEIARMVAFLADEKSGFITGANFAINGGQHMY